MAWMVVGVRLGGFAESKWKRCLLKPIDKPTDGEPLEDRYRDHALSGYLKGHRDCHIGPDWLLIYLLDRETQEITFVRTGSHSELFG